VFTRITVMEPEDDIFLPIGEGYPLEMGDFVDELGLDETDASHVAAPVVEPVDAAIVAYQIVKVVADMMTTVIHDSLIQKRPRRKSMRVIKHQKGKSAKGKPKAPAPPVITGLLCDEDMNHMTEPVKSRLYSQQIIDEMEKYHQNIVNSKKVLSEYISTSGASEFKELQARTGLDAKRIKQWLKLRPVSGAISGRESAPRMWTPLVLTTPVARKFQVIHVIQ